MRAIVASALLLTAASCLQATPLKGLPAPIASPAADTPVPSVIPTATAASDSPIPARSNTFAAVCGTISDFTAETVQANGFLVLDAPGRAPLKITIAAGRLGGRAANYVCVQVRAGTPHPLFDGFFTPGTPGFIDDGKVPASVALPAPTGFVIPQTCAYVAPPIVGAEQTDWWIDCGATNNSNARGTLGPILSQQGWALCASGLASASWQKSGVMLGISESSLAPGDYPRITQFIRVISPC